MLFRVIREKQKAILPYVIYGNARYVTCSETIYHSNREISANIKNGIPQRTLHSNLPIPAEWIGNQSELGINITEKKNEPQRLRGSHYGKLNSDAGS